MKKIINTILLSGLFIFLIFSCKTKTVEPDLSTLYEVKTNEFIKAEIDGKQFDYRTVLKTDYQEALKLGRTTGMLECAGCKNQMYMAFGQKDPSSTTPYSWSTNIENATTNLLVDENTPVFYIAFILNEKIDDKNSRWVYSARTAKPVGGDWSDPMGEMTTKITSNENGKVSGTFSGKSLDGKEIKNGSFSLRYKL
jgi:hypothetical protein